MICKAEGVLYGLSNYNSEDSQQVQFTHKNIDGTYVSGTTNEEVVEMMLDRFNHFQKKRFSSENEVIIMMFKDIRRVLKKRLNNKIQLVKKSNEKYSVKDE